MSEEKAIKDKIISIIFNTIDEHNLINNEELKLSKSLETVLLGKNSNLDSLGFINLLVSIESEVQKQVNDNISVIDEDLFLLEDGPYQSVDTLSKYISSKL